MTPQVRASLFGWTLSLAIHALMAVVVYTATTAPEAPFDFQLPTEVEFGVTDAVEVSQGAASAAESPAAGAQGAAPGEGPGLDGGVPLDAAVAEAGVDASVDGGPADAGRRRRRRRDAGRPPEVAQADVADEGEGGSDEGEGTGDEPGEGRGVAFLPEGSQIALRIDVARIRRSPFADDVRALLGAIPDWQAVLGGSGVEPLDDLDRLLIATPNFDRSRVVMAGRATGGQDAIRAAAERLASARGETLEWRRVRGFPVADWHDPDPTDRVVALIGPRHFVIARPADLPRVLAIARQRARDGEELPADALLSMEPEEGLSLEVEGARAYYRARPGRRQVPREIFPERLRLALEQLPEDQIGMRSVWSYEDDAQASRAAAFFDRERRRYANPLLLNLAGFGALFPFLDRTTVEADGVEVHADADLENAHVHGILGLGQRALGRRPAGASQEPTDDRGSTAPGAPSPPTPPTAPSVPAPPIPE